MMILSCTEQKVCECVYIYINLHADQIKEVFEYYDVKISVNTRRPDFVACKQQRSVQSDQRLCHSHIGK